jgi:hypothetical protein
MTSVADNRDRGIDVEDESCSQWPLEPAAEDRGEWFDLVATDSTIGRLPPQRYSQRHRIELQTIAPNKLSAKREESGR